MLQRLTKAKGKPLSPRETAEIVELHRRIEESQSKLDAFHARRAASLDPEPNVNVPLSPDAMALISANARAARARIKSRAERDTSKQQNHFEAKPSNRKSVFGSFLSRPKNLLPALLGLGLVVPLEILTPNTMPYRDRFIFTAAAALIGAVFGVYALWKRFRNAVRPNR